MKRNYIAFYQHADGDEQTKVFEAESLTLAYQRAKGSEPELYALYDVRTREDWLEFQLCEAYVAKTDLQRDLADIERKQYLLNVRAWELAQEAYSRGYGISHDELRRIAADAGQVA